MRVKLKPLVYGIMLAIAHPAIVMAAPTPGIPDYANANGAGTSFAESQGPSSHPILDVNVTQSNSVINWNGSGFNVGTDGTVNFNSSVGPTSVLNYDNSGAMSNIQGVVNNGGNKLFLVNPNGISDSSGAFSGLIANDAANVTLDTAGKLNIINKGSSLVNYGAVTGTASKEFDLDVELSNGTGLRTGNMILGGNTTRMDVVKEAGGTTIDSDHITFQGNKTIITSKEGQGDIVFDGLKSNNIEVNEFKNNTFTGDLNGENITVNAYGQASQTTVDNATGTLKNFEVNKGGLKVSSDETGGVLIIDGLKNTSTNANTELAVSSGATLQVNNLDVKLTKVGNSTANNFTVNQTGSGGALILVGGTVDAANAIKFENKGSNANNTLQMTDVTLKGFKTADIEDKINLTNVTATGQAGSTVNLVKANGNVKDLVVNDSNLNVSTGSASDVLIIDGLKQVATDANTSISSGSGNVTISNADIAITKGSSDTDNNLTITKGTGNLTVSGKLAAAKSITSTGNTVIDNSTFSGFQDLTIKNRTVGFDGVTANGSQLNSTTHIENTQGTINNLTLNNGVLKVESDIAGGVMTFNSLTHHAYVGGMEVNISNGSTVNLNNTDINYNSDKDINVDGDLSSNDMVNAGATNSFTAMAKGSGGNLNVTGGNIYAEKSIRFQHEAGAGGTLNLNRVFILSREADIELVKNTQLTTTQDGGGNTVELSTDQREDDDTNKGVIIIDDAGVKGGVMITEGKSYTNAQKNDGDNDWWRWSSDNRIVVDWDKVTIDSADIKEGEALFEAKALKIPNPTGDGDGGGVGDGGDNGNTTPPTDPQPPEPTLPWPTDPDTGFPIDPNTGWPIDPGTGFPINPDTGVPTDPSTLPPGTGNPWEIDPNTGWPIDPETGLPVDPSTMPDSHPTDPTDPTDPGNGGGGTNPTDPGNGGGTTDPTNPGGGGTDPTDPGTGGGTTDPSNPGTGGGTTDPTNPGSGGGTTDPTNPGSGGGTTDPTNPGSGGGTTDPTNPGSGGGTTDPTNPGSGSGGTDPTTPGGSGGGTTPTNPDTGLPLDPDTGLPTFPETPIPTNPETGLPTTPGGGFPTDPTQPGTTEPGSGSGNPGTVNPSEPGNGGGTDNGNGNGSGTGTGTDNGAGNGNGNGNGNGSNPGAGLPTDPVTGWPIDPETEWPIDPETGIPTDPETIPSGSEGSSGGSNGGSNGGSGTGTTKPGVDNPSSGESGSGSSGGSSETVKQPETKGWSLMGWMSDLFNDNNDDEKKKKKKKAQDAARAAKAKHDAQKKAQVEILKG